jgi:hypothetical protein
MINMSACCGQGVSNLMSQFKTTSTNLTTFSVKNHPHDLKPMSTMSPMTTTQTTPQTFTNTFTKTGFMKFSRPTQ